MDTDMDTDNIKMPADTDTKISIRDQTCFKWTLHG